MKKVLSILLLVVMLISVMAGCSSQNNVNPPATSGQSTAQATTSAQAATQGNEPAKEKKLIEMSIGFDNISTLNDDEWGKQLQEKFNIKVTLVPVAKDKLGLLASADNLPDFFRMNVSGKEALFSQFLQEELIRDVPDEMIAKYPNLKGLQDAAKIQGAVRKTYGKNYALAKNYAGPEPDKQASTSGFYYRADWLKNVGIEKVPETMDELYNMMRAFTFKDPDQNGKQDTYGTSGWLWQVHYMPWVDMYGWVKEDGKWIPGYLSDKMIDALNFWNRAYKEKILDPEYANANSKNLFKQGITGMHNGNRDIYWLDQLINKEFAASNPGIANPTDVVKLLPPLKKDANSQAAWPQMLCDESILVSSKVDDEKLDRFLEMHEWFQTEEAAAFYSFGIEGKDYTVENGQYVSKLPKGSNGKPENLDTVYQSVKIKDIFNYGWASMVDPKFSNYSDNLIAAAKDVAAMYNPATVGMQFDIMMANVPAKFDATYSADSAEADLQKIISGNNVAGDFAAMKKKALETGGIQKVIDDVNKYAAEHGIQ